MNLKSTFLTLAAAASSMYGMAQYCTSSASSTADSECDAVVLNGNSSNINNNTAGVCAIYSDFTSLTPANLSPGMSYSISITAGTCGGNYGKYVNAWIDFNANNTFDAGEELGGAGGVGPFTATTTTTFSFTVPATATAGNTRLRVIVKESGAANNACASYSWGETEDYTVTILPPVLGVFVADTVIVPCFGDLVTVPSTTVGGTAPYTYSWNTGSTNDTLFGAGAGTYTVIVTDNVGDSDTATMVVLDPPAVVLDSVNIITQLVCDYDVSEAMAYGSGGTPITAPYTWDTNSAMYGPDASQTGTAVTFAGNYASAGPFDIGFDFVYFGDTFSQFRLNTEGFIHFDNHTSGWTSDHAIPSTNGPAAVVAFSWEDLDPTAGGSVNYYTMGTAPNRTLVVNYHNVPYQGAANLTTDVIDVQVQLHETSGCIEMHSANVGNSIYANNAVQGLENYDEDEAVFVPGRNYQVWSVTNDYTSFCPTTGGLSYAWSEGTQSPYVAGLAPGTYTVSVMDENGCFDSENITIAAPQSALTSSLVATDVNCYGVLDGTIDPGITGGVSPMVYSWASGESTATLSNLGPGTYSISAQDAVGCTIEVNNIVVQMPDILLSSVYNVQNVLCPGDLTGSVSAVASGGVAPYTYTWLPVNTMGQSITGITNGNYNLKVVDANGCESYNSVAILAESTTPVVDLGYDIVNRNGATINLDAGNHTTYLWSTGATGSSINVTQSGTYWVEVTNQDGCMGTDTIDVEIWALSVNELQKAITSIYPNPTKDKLQIELDQTISNVDIQIYDTKGSLVYSEGVSNNGLITLDLSSLPSGIYTLNIADDKNVATHKLSIVK